jgi:hypothetical protein
MTKPETTTEQERHKKFVVGFYSRVPPRERLVGGMNDAAHMCDAIAADILQEHTKRKRPTKQGILLSQAVRRAGDAIWEMMKEVRDAKN